MEAFDNCGGVDVVSLAQVTSQMGIDLGELDLVVGRLAVGVLGLHLVDLQQERNVRVVRTWLVRCWARGARGMGTAAVGALLRRPRCWRRNVGVGLLLAGC